MEMKKSWLHAAKMLTLGQSRRIDCCNPSCITLSSNTAKVEHTDKGYRVYCFACNFNDFVGHGIRCLSKLNLEVFTTAQCNAWTTNVHLPSDFSLAIPFEVAVPFLYKAGIYSSTARQYNIGWSEKLRRIILPVYANNKLVYLQARAEKGVHPKYINPKVDKASIAFKSQKSKHKVFNFIVVTEAILSAIRTGVYSESWSTLGSTLTDAIALELSNTNKHVVLWYDPDTAGVRGSTKAKNKLMQLDTKVTEIRTIKKPKDYTNEEILSVLQGVSL